jgi:hypothetical protein
LSIFLFKLLDEHLILGSSDDGSIEKLLLQFFLSFFEAFLDFDEFFHLIDLDFVFGEESLESFVLKG